MSTIENRCKQHPKYKVIRKPGVPQTRENCTCWALWDAKQANKTVDTNQK